MGGANPIAYIIRVVDIKINNCNCIGSIMLDVNDLVGVDEAAVIGDEVVFHLNSHLKLSFFLVSLSYIYNVAY